MWVLQEVILGTTVVLHWGSRGITLPQLFGVHQNIMIELNATVARIANPSLTTTLASYFFDYLTTAVFRIERLRSLYQQWTCAGSLAEEEIWSLLAKMLVVSRGSQSTDPRDKVYALLGLLPAVCTLELQPLYGQLPEDTWVHTMSLILRKSKSLFLFSQLVTQTTNQSRQQDHPNRKARMPTVP